MAPKQPCAKYQYVVTSAGPKILPVDEPSLKDEESPADYNAGGYLPVKVHDTFKQGRYRVVRKLGWGHFSTVWLVKDAQLNHHSALKVVKSAGRYAETARDEIKLLSHVQSVSPSHPGRSHIVSFLDSFTHTSPEASHICIVFEPLGENLLALIERHKKKGVPRALVRVIAKQVLLGLQYLHDECDLVHTDIKPENILISIPDIEAHITSELLQSPLPTSRRVGVPLPTKSRAGVSIPGNQQRPRRQVQIFDSQPLASPGRSTGKSGTGSQGGSGTNSASGSYVAQMHLTRLNSTGVIGYVSGTAASLSSSAPKVPNAQANSGPMLASPARVHVGLKAERVQEGENKDGHESTNAGLNQTSPSTSSSSSSISSALTSTAAGSSSIVSTPPTSLSHSLGSAISAFAGFAKRSGKGVEGSELSGDVIRPIEHPIGDERSGLPMKGKGLQVSEADLDGSVSSSWKDKLAAGVAVSLSWREKISVSLSASTSRTSNLSPGGGKVKGSAARVQGHARRPSSGVSAASAWKDPGAAAPAPAVVVSAIVGADGEEAGDYFQMTNVKGDGASASANGSGNGGGPSECSSATVTGARPSPSGTPHPPMDGLTKLSGPDVAPRQNHSTETRSCGAPVSLLTQTAPGWTATEPSSHNRTYSRTSPTSQSSRLYARVQQTETVSSSSLTPTPASPSPLIPNRILPPLMINSTARPTAIPSLSGRSSSRSPPPPPICIKIADLGNATPSTKHFTEDIQTRQYRAPEAILGRKDWGARVDVWSVACVVFELLTAEYLFDPQGQGELFSKDDDHMAQIIELLGDFAMEAKMGGKYSREIFDHTGALRYIRTLKPWPLKRVMTEKYLYTEADAAVLCGFLEPMLVIDMRQRKDARDMLDNAWLEACVLDEPLGEW